MSDQGDRWDRASAAALDASDPLAQLRSRFVITDPDLIYLDGNSLGRLPVVAAERLHRAVADQWGHDLVRAWPGWIDEPTRVGDVLAAGVLGALPGEVLIADSTTVNLFKLAAAAAALAVENDPARRVLLTTAANFPTDRYVLAGLARFTGLEVRLLDLDPESDPVPQLAAALSPDSALLCLSHVDYASGERFDIEAITRLARERGVRVLWDLSHSAGAIPIELEACGAELAVGCTYKYLNAGPGAPAYLYVRRSLQSQLRSPIWGWFAQEDQFGMAERYDPASGIRRFAAGTPPILGLPLVETGAELIAEAGIERLAEKSRSLTTMIIDLADAWLTPLDFRLETPRDPARRAGHVSLAHPAALQICRALIENANVVPDYRASRGGGTIRLGPAPLYTRHVDIWDAMDRLRRLVQAGEHLTFSASADRVT